MSSAPIAAPARSPVLSIDRGIGWGLERGLDRGLDHGHGGGLDHGGTGPAEWIETHSHPEPMLLWTSTATLTVTAAGRDWLIPPGYGLWVPGGADHAVAVLRFGVGSALVFDPDRCPITWTRPTGVAVGPLQRELLAHLHRTGPRDPSRPHAEALTFELLTPLPDQNIQVSMPTDPRVRTIAERLVADPADPRELAAWADHVHAGVRTLSRLFLSETGLSFARWRTQVRVRAAIQLLADGATVNAVARAVGYRKTSAFINAFRRATGQTPGTYIHPNPAPAPAPAPAPSPEP